MAALGHKEDRNNEGLFKEVGDAYICWDKSAVENIPADVNAFFGHPLTAATNAIEGADSLALLHEYHNLPPIDNKEHYHYIEIGDNKIHTSVNELLLTDPSKPEASSIHTVSPKPQDLRICRASEEDVESSNDTSRPESSREQMVIYNQNCVPQTSSFNHLPVYSVPSSMENRPQRSIEQSIPRRNRPPGKKAKRRLQHPDLTLNAHQSNMTHGLPPAAEHRHPLLDNQMPVSHPPLQLPQYQEPTLQPLPQNLQQQQTFHSHLSFVPLQPIAQKEPSYCSFSSMDTLNNNVPPNYTSSVAQGHSALQAALNSKPLTMPIISQTSYQPLVQNVNPPTVKYEAAVNPILSNGTQRTINPIATWTPSPNGQVTFNLNTPVQVNSDVSQVLSQGTYATNVSGTHQLPHQGQQFIARESNALDHHEVLSVDSGISDSCVSPPQPSPRIEAGRTGQTTVATSSASSVNSKGKRRHSAGSGTNSTRPEKEPTIQKRLHDTTGFHYNLEAPTSSFQKVDEDRVTYINKSQYYGLTLSCDLSSRKDPALLRSDVVKSVVIVVLRCDKNVEERAAWELWYSRQHNIKQRVIDIDTKNSSGIIIESIHELAHNALSFNWRPREGKSRASIALHCLSTDFSNQKGVKGVPLHLQIDTFEDASDRFPVHRAYCQVKAFCDKGAERKLRDEDRRKEAKLRLSESRPTRRKQALTHPSSSRSEFYSMLDLEKTPFLFYGYQVSNQQLYDKCVYPSSRYTGPSQCNCGCHETQTQSQTYSPSKKPKLEEGEKVLLYARRPDETAFTALVLRLPTAHCLKAAIEDKFQVPAHEIRNVFKHSMKGLIVKLDDDIIQNYVNESTFEIEVTYHQAGYDVQLREIEPSISRYR